MTNPLLHEITESAFLEADAGRRLFSHEYARRFAIIKLDAITEPWALSWCSDVIQPNTIVDNVSGITWIAVDERIAGLSMNGQIVFALATSTAVLSVQTFSSGVVVISESQAFVINRTCSIRSLIDFPDIAFDFELDNDDLRVELADGSKMTFSL
ncbi:hypothetical protein [Schlesneria paludicola]|uniref:hypothetical protein n=1 Tax=Schlesneria paludicola TaxID=360056 RepID=UPI00029A4D86|nr:hypothetical protein [Schlesneria paludicola]